MFEKNFNFENTERETVSEEIRKLLTDTGINLSSEESNYMEIWKNKLLELSGKN